MVLQKTSVNRADIHIFLHMMNFLAENPFATINQDKDIEEKKAFLSIIEISSDI